MKKIFKKADGGLNGFRLVSMGKTSNFFISNESSDEFLKGFWIGKGRSSIPVSIWFCPLLQLDIERSNLLSMIFDGWMFGAKDNGMIPLNVNIDLMAPLKTDDMLAVDLENKILEWSELLSLVSGPMDLVKLCGRNPDLFSGTSFKKMNLGLLQCYYGSFESGIEILKAVFDEVNPEDQAELYKFLDACNGGRDKMSMYSEKLMCSNKDYLRKKGFI